MSAGETTFIDAPLVLVSQVGRSGGSLLAQLFDGHPQVYAHPFEIRIWASDSRKWPVLDPAGEPAEWFGVLGDEKWERMAESGFGKPGRNPFAERLRYPFTYSRSAHRALFLELTEELQIVRSRDILDCYFTSFFHTWQEWEPTGREVAITGFMPRTATSRESVRRFRSDYPDGKLVTIVRDPRAWYASRYPRHSPDRGIAYGMGEWLRHARLLRKLLSKPRPWLLAILFDDLVLDPEPTMRRVADFAGIEFDPCLLQATYLGQPMLPNSSFEVSEHGINPAMATRGEEIGPEARAEIAGEALPLYEELEALLRKP